jgi:dolichol-phosphate mannosyltransferase
MNVSIIVPCYNTAESLNELHARIDMIMKKLNVDYELIFVNDSSPQNDWRIICEIADKDHHVKGINLSRNFGQYKAITAGLAYAKGDIVFVMDGDLQDRPEEIPALIDKYNEGYDIVYAVRSNRQDTRLKKLYSRIFHRVFNYFTSAHTDAGIGTFSLFSRKAVNAMLSIHEEFREIYLTSYWIGFKSAKVEVQHAERKYGKSSYNFKKAAKLALNAILSFSDKPLRFVICIGFSISGLSLMYGIYIIIRKFVVIEEVEGWTSIIFSVWFLGGVIISFIGIIGLYIGKIFEEVKRRPLYIVDEVVDFSIKK